MPPHSRSPFFWPAWAKGHTDPMSTAELRELTASSAVEVQRVCSLFSCLQQLVIAESIKPQLSSTPILPLLAYAADGVNLIVPERRDVLSSVVPDTCPPVLINRARTLQALIQCAADCPWAIQDPGHGRADCLFSSNAVQIVCKCEFVVESNGPEASLSMASPRRTCGASRPPCPGACSHSRANRTAEGAVRALIVLVLSPSQRIEIAAIAESGL
jgi:hypothetical protein